MRFATLDEWLSWQETLHPKAIDLGLDRVRTVAERMGLLAPSYRVITVAGTNGKGSSVAMLESILSCAGLRIAAYTSPHLHCYNERIRVAGQPAGDEAIVTAFDRIDQARGDISLSYFEFGTLAALDVFRHAMPDIAVLEVGLGGRLDAVNILDPDCALVTAIGIDHVEWLGPDRESIGREKAGIFRAGRPAICADPQPPASLRRTAEELGSQWFALNEQFGYSAGDDQWTWWGPATRLEGLPMPALRGPFQLQNAAGVLMVLHAVGLQPPLTLQSIRAGLQQAHVAGRFSVVPGPVEEIYDVAHNPHGAAALAAALAARPCAGRTLAVCAMLADKDAAGVATALHDRVHAWYLAGLDAARGQSAEALAMRMPSIVAPQLHASPGQALVAARADSLPGDRIVVFGSFHTIAELLPPGL